MIQHGTYLNVQDNSGARSVMCIKVLKGYKSRYGYIGDLILISVKKLRTKRRLLAKVKKGDVLKALIVRTKTKVKLLNNGNFNSFTENSVILINKQNKLIGTRIFGLVPKKLRFSKFFRIISLSSGIIS
jgi:large subunit ribosomal protein L14